jgi:tetratricopeptide (TPR) repeat protein
MTPDMCHSKPWLQWQILQDLIGTSPSAAEAFLPQADPKVSVQLTAQFVSAYVRDKKIDRAEQLLRRIGDQEQFPFDAAADLMLARPAGPQRTAVFQIAVDNYRTFGDGKNPYLRDEDLATIVVRFWHELPAPNVLAAIDDILDQAKEHPPADEDNNISYSTGKGSVQFTWYEYRVFEFLPVLDELDSARADSLRRDQAKVASALQKYPRGLQSLNPYLRNSPLSEEEEKEQARNQDYPSIVAGASPTELAQEQQEDEASRQIEAKQMLASDQAASDPPQAFETAMSLPMWEGPTGIYSPRCGTLLVVARIVGQKNPEIAKKAIDEAGKGLEDAKPRLAGTLRVGIVRAYLKLGDNERAEKALNEGMREARKLYDSDTDASDPNLALKAFWPSSALWGTLVALGAKISPDVADHLIGEISDDEIRSMQKVWVANTLLGANAFARCMEWRRSGHNGTWGFSSAS